MPFQLAFEAAASTCSRRAESEELTTVCLGRYTQTTLRWNQSAGDLLVSGRKNVSALFLATK